MVRGGRELGHVQADLGEDDLRGGRADAGDFTEAFDRVRPAGRRCGLFGRVPAAWVVRFGRLQQVVDAGGEGADLRRQCVDLSEQHPGQFGVVVVEAPVERLDQRRSLGLHPAPGQVGEAPRVTLAGDQRFDHVPRRQRVQRGRHRGQLDERVFEQLLQPLPVPGAFPGEIDPQPGIVAQLPDRRRRHKRWPQQPLLGELGQPHRVELVFSELN